MLVRSAQAYNYSRKAGRAPAKGTIVKTKSKTIAFFLFSSFPSPRCFFCSPFLFLRYCDFGPSRAYHKETSLSTSFHSLDRNFVRLDFKKSATYTVYITHNYTKQDQYVFSECRL